MEATAMDWKHEMNRMLAAFHRETRFTLGNMQMAFKRNGFSFNAQFREYFLEESINRIKGTYDQFALDSMFEEQINHAEENSVMIRSVVKPEFGPIVKQQMNQLIEIDDSDDEEPIQIKSETSKFVFDEAKANGPADNLIASIAIYDSDADEMIDLPKVPDDNITVKTDLSVNEPLMNLDLDQMNASETINANQIIINTHNTVEETTESNSLIEVDDSDDGENGTINLRGTTSKQMQSQHRPNNVTLKHLKHPIVSKVARPKNRSRRIVYKYDGLHANGEERCVGSNAIENAANVPASKRIGGAVNIENRNSINVESKSSTLINIIDTGGVNNLLMASTDASKRGQRNTNAGSPKKAPQTNQVTIETSGLRPAVEYSRVKRLKCRFCEYVTCRIGNLNTHIRTHTGERPYRCDRCGKGFITAQSLKSHAITHTEVFPFHCKGCFSRFSLKDEKEAHDKVCVGRRYECYLCKKSIRNKISLESHMRSHTGEKSFRCDICMRRFVCETSLENHLNRIHTKINP